MAATRTTDQTAAASEVIDAPVARLWVAAFCGYLSLGAAFQELPPFTTSRFGAGPLVVGLVVSVASLSSALCRPMAGRLADQGRARASILFGASCGVLGGLGHLWSPDIPVLVIARLLLGAGEGAVFSAAIGWTMRSAPPARRGRFAGWFGLSMWGGLSLGPVLAVVLRDTFGTDAVWIAVAALPAVTLLLAASTRGAHVERARETATATLSSWVPASARWPGVLFGLASFGYGAINALLLLRLRHSGLGGESLGLPLFAVTFLAVRTVGSPLINRWSGAVTAAFSAGVEAVGLLLIGLCPVLPGVLAGAMLVGFGLGPLYPAMVEIIVGRSRGEQQGSAVAVMTSFWDLGLVVAGPVGGAIAGSAGYPVAFVTAAALAVVSAVFVLRLRVRRA